MWSSNLFWAYYTSFASTKCSWFLVGYIFILLVFLLLMFWTFLEVIVKGFLFNQRFFVAHCSCQFLLIFDKELSECFIIRFLAILNNLIRWLMHMNANFISEAILIKILPVSRWQVGFEETNLGGLDLMLWWDCSCLSWLSVFSSEYKLLLSVIFHLLELL